MYNAVQIFLSMYNVVQILQRRGCLASTQVPWHLHIPKLPRYEQFHHPLPLLASSYWIKCIFSTVGANSTLTVVSCNCKPSLTEQGSVGRCQLLKESLAWSASTHPHRASQLARTQICMQWSHFKAVGGELASDLAIMQNFYFCCCLFCRYWRKHQLHTS